MKKPEEEPPDSAVTVLFNDEKHFSRCHYRWVNDRNNWTPGTVEEDLPEEWYRKQCGACRFFIPLSGLFRSDWGVCSNATSKFERRAMFEHDGCDAFAHSDTWVADELHH